ncbi:MAG: DNA repair protein RecO [Muribaculaceae bacterium]|nr:DNA repair protein RecO [Muribaculaceae bacterium]
MEQSLHCIALRLIKYNEKSMILTAYSRERGRVGLLVPAGSGKTANRNRALLMPLSRFECVADVKQGRELYQFRGLVAHGNPAGMACNPVKQAMAMFVADLLNTILREPMTDELLYGFLADAVDYLANSGARGVANFHLALLVRMQRFLGIEPDYSTYRAGALMDLTEGRFVMTPPTRGEYLTREEALVAARLGRMTFRNMHGARLSRGARNEILDRMLRYYSIHGYRVEGLGSLDVLRTLF